MEARDIVEAGSHSLAAQACIVRELGEEIGIKHLQTGKDIPSDAMQNFEVDRDRFTSKFSEAFATSLKGGAR